MSGALQKSTPVAVVFLDLDGFNQVNDKLGHAAGDKYLETVADVLGALALHRGKVYRYGGNEFALLLPNVTCLEAGATAERLRASIERASVGGEVRGTASIGVVGRETFHPPTAEQFVDQARRYYRRALHEQAVLKWFDRQGKSGATLGEPVYYRDVLLMQQRGRH